jgi:hypothetical protein
LHRARQEYIIDFEEKATEEVRTISGPSARSHYETIERRLHPI